MNFLFSNRRRGSLANTRINPFIYHISIPFDLHDLSLSQFIELKTASMDFVHTEFRHLKWPNPLNSDQQNGLIVAAKDEERAS